MRKLLLFAILIISGFVLQAQTKVACVGNSVTYGYGLKERDKTSYPSRLQQLLGDAYRVGNFGHSGATLLNKGHRPYMGLPAFKEALAFRPDIVVIHLGLNDTDPRNWPNYQDEFVSDYTALIDSFRTVNPKTKIYVCRMSPIFHWHPRFQSGTRDWFWQIQAAIGRVAANNHATLIDFHEVLYDKPFMMPDALHPDAEGAALLAETVYGTLTGNFGGLRMPDVYRDGMVLQRNEKLRISGTANAGEKVKVSIAKQTQRVRAGSDGAWAVELDAMKAGGPYTLTVEAASRKLEYKDVLVGEVWLCSGQSNMFFRVKESVEKAQLTRHAATHPAIRIFNMKPLRETYAEEWDTTVLKALNNLEYFQSAGWQAADSASVQDVSAIAYAFAATLSDSLKVPVGIILNSLGGSPAEAWIDRRTLEFEIPRILYDWKKNDHIQDWVRGRAALNIRKAGNPLQRHPYEPAYLYESAIKPLNAYPLKGVIWYQGESNAHNTELHEQLFPLLIDSWRNTWKKELPFYYVQLSSLNRPSWPLFRDSQRRLMSSRPALGMAVSSDRGDSLDVHPRQKLEIGQRLGAWALAETYGMNLVPSGPLYREVEFKDKYAFVSFDYADCLAASGNAELIGFEIADDSGVYHPAEAEVVNDRVKVWNDKIKKPKYVRYGWQPFTRANLINSAGYPASTFRTSPL